MADEPENELRQLAQMTVQERTPEAAPEVDKAAERDARHQSIVDDIGNQAFALQMQLNGAGPERAAVIMREIGLLYLQLPTGVAPPAALSNAAAAAETATEVDDEEAPGASRAGRLRGMAALERALLAALPEEERRRMAEYLQTIRPDEKYKVASLDENGKEQRDADGKLITKEVDGEKLLKDMHNVIKESLPPEKQKQVEEELKKTAPETQESKPKSRVEQLDELKESLDNVKGKKLAEIDEAQKEGLITKEQAEKKSDAVHETFDKAKDKLRITRTLHAEKEKNARDANDPNLDPVQRGIARAKHAVDGGRVDIDVAEKNMQKSLEDVRKAIPEKADETKEVAKEQSQDKGKFAAVERQGHHVPDEQLVVSNVAVNNGASRGQGGRFA